MLSYKKQWYRAYNFNEQERRDAVQSRPEGLPLAIGSPPPWARKGGQSPEGSDCHNHRNQGRGFGRVFTEAGFGTEPSWHRRRWQAVRQALGCLA